MDIIPIWAITIYITHTLIILIYTINVCTIPVREITAAPPVDQWSDVPEVPTMYPTHPLLLPLLKIQVPEDLVEVPGTMVEVTTEAVQVLPAHQVALTDLLVQVLPARRVVEAETQVVLQAEVPEEDNPYETTFFICTNSIDWI